MSDAFFTNPRPFTKRKREDGPNFRSGADSRRGAPSRGGGGGSSRGARGSGSARGARASARGGRGGRGGRDEPNAQAKGKRRADEPRGKRRADDDEELDEPEDDDGAFDSDDALPSPDELDSDDQEDEAETPAQKRLRLSQMYLKSLEKDARQTDDAAFDAADLDRDLIAERLQQDVVRRLSPARVSRVAPLTSLPPVAFSQLEHSGKLHLNIADSVRPALPLPLPCTVASRH